MAIRSACARAGAVLLAASAVAAERLATIERVDLDDLASQVFSLPTEQRVSLEGTVLGDDDEDAYGTVWLLDAATRKVVWQLDEAARTRSRRGLVTFENTTRLPAGEYELYVSTYRSWRGWESGHFDLPRFLEELFRRIDDDNLEDLVGQVEVWVEGDGTPGGDNTLQRVRERLGGGALVAFVGVGDDAYLRQGFELAAAADLRVYAIGEATAEGDYDSAWIANADTGERVWRLDYRHSSEAGGAPKNRVAEGTIHLPAGRWVAAYVTDGSHSYPDFNAAPPFDPMGWGLVIRAADGRVLATPFEPAASPGRNVLVELVGMRDNEHRQQGFTLARPIRVRIVATGEATGDEMVDYGWIIDAATRETVWEMRAQGSEHAGGARKNRLVEKTVELPAGSYVVHYVTDSSHAYRSWNAAPPFEPHRWGITVLAVGEGFKPEDVAPYEVAEEPGVLARIERVGDDEHRIETFRLAAESEVEIVALGEGSGGTMVDYAWIEADASGRTVWEMTYRMTEHAGGAAKNRRFKGVVRLPAGAYSLHYESDGSHSYSDWNAPPPRDPEGWGVTVRLAGRLPADAEPGSRNEYPSPIIVKEIGCS